MTIATSAALGTVITVLDGGLIPGITSDRARRRADAGTGRAPRRRMVGGASLYIVADKGDAQAAAAWDFITFLIERPDAVDVGRGDRATCRSARTPSSSSRSGRRTPPIPASRSPTTSSLAGADDLAAVGPVLGPLREVRSVTAGAVAAIFGGADVASLARAAAQPSPTP